MGAASRVAVVLASVALAGLTGCGSASHPATKATRSPSAKTEAEAQLTVGRASTAFAAFLPKFNRLPSDPSLLSQLTAGPLAASEKFLAGRGGPTVGTLSGEHLLVPFLTSYPRWFLAAGTASDGQGFLFVMVQQSPEAMWRADAELFDLTSSAQILPALKAAGFGTSQQATQVEADDAALEMAPSGLAAAYARAVNHAGSAAGEFGAGPYTSERVASNQQTARQALVHGWKLTDLMTTLNEPLYGLELPAGNGALVIFFTKETYTWTARSAAAVIPHGASNLSTPPAQFLSRLGVTAASAGLAITSTSIDENLAFVGPQSTKSVIVVNNGLAVSLSKS